MKGKHFFLIVISFLVLDEFSCFYAEKVGLYDSEVLDAHPELIQQQVWERGTDSSSSQVDKNEVKGIYDFGGGAISEPTRAGSRDENQTESRGTTRRSAGRKGKGSSEGEFEGLQTQGRTKSFSQVAESIKPSEKKPKRNPSPLQARGSLGLLDFDEEVSPEMPDLTTVVTDDVKPAINIE